MTTTTSFPKRSISPRMAGTMALVLALLFTMANYILQTKLNYPAILLDTASLANSLVAQGEIAVLLGFIGLLLCGALLVVVSLGLVPHLEEKRRRRVIVTGGASGMLWVVGALLGLALVPLWGSAQANAAHVVATIMLVLAELAAPLLLALWTVTLARQFRAYRVLGGRKWATPGLLAFAGVGAQCAPADRVGVLWDRGYPEYSRAVWRILLAALALALWLPFACSVHEESDSNSTDKRNT